MLRGAPRRLNASYYNHERKIVVAKGMQEYLWQNEIPFNFKHYGYYVKKVSERVKKAALEPFHEAGLVYLRQADADKDACARQIATEQGITSGPVCMLSALEPCPTFDYIQSKIARRKRPCHVLYQYRLDERFGWMYARIQTWLPFQIQIGWNGREWLARQMSDRGMKLSSARTTITHKRSS